MIWVYIIMKRSRKYWEKKIETEGKKLVDTYWAVYIKPPSFLCSFFIDYIVFLVYNITISYSISART